MCPKVVRDVLRTMDGDGALYRGTEYQTSHIYDYGVQTNRAMEEDSSSPNGRQAGSG